MEEHKDRVAGPQKMVGTEFSPKTPRTGFFRRRMILMTSAARPCRSSGCDPPPSCVASSLAPGGIKLKGLSTASEGRALALLPSCPPPAPTPSSPADPSVPFFAKNISQTPPPPHRWESIREYLVAEKTYRIGRAGDPYAGVRILCFSKTLRTGLPDSY
jgi:hypothetical protein